VWHKPEKASEVVDYHVYMDGRVLGNRRREQRAVLPGQAPTSDGFYAADAAHFHVKVSVHSFTVEGLSPDSEHRFSVRSVLRDGSESADSKQRGGSERARSLRARHQRCSVSRRGRTERTLNLIRTRSRRPSTACTPGGKVLVPAGTVQDRARSF